MCRLTAKHSYIASRYNKFNNITEVVTSRMSNSEVTSLINKLGVIDYEK